MPLPCFISFLTPVVIRNHLSPPLDRSSSRAGGSPVIFATVLQRLEQWPSQHRLSIGEGGFLVGLQPGVMLNTGLQETLRPVEIGCDSLGVCAGKVPGFFQVLRRTGQESKEGAAPDDYQGLPRCGGQGRALPWWFHAGGWHTPQRSVLLSGQMYIFIGLVAIAPRHHGD